MDDKPCIFCRIVKKEIPAKVLFEDNMIMAFEDARPEAPLHVLIVPKHHIEKVADLKEEDGGLIGEMVLAAKRIAKEKAVEESGYRIVMNCNKDAGQEVFHLHLHLLAGRKFSWPPG